MTNLAFAAEPTARIDAYSNRTDDGVAYELVGPVGAPVVAVLGGISANRHVT